MECTKVNCPMQAGTKTDNCGENCPWKTTAKIGDLISRTAAIEAFDDERVDRNYGDVSPESVIKVIEYIPAVDAVPVVHGWWVKPEQILWPVADCSVCGERCMVFNTANYCPNCGAKMDGEVR